MPDLMTHVLCANDTLKLIKNKTVKNEIEKRKTLYNFGAQGPDTFFYYNFWPWKKSKDVVSYARMLHNEKTGQFFIDGIKYLKNIDNANDYYDLLTYIAGFITHYCLDKNAHPYIYYYSGINSDGKINKYKYYHKKLEAFIDAILFKERYGYEINKYPVHSLIKLGREFPSSVTGFYKYSFKDLFNIELSDNLVDISHDYMYLVYRIMYDPSGVKWGIAKTLDKVTFNEYKYSGMVYHKVKDKTDYLNISNNEWKDPCTMQINRTSFIDIYKNSIIESIALINVMIDAIKNFNISRLKDEFRDISYLTGKDTNSNMKMLYSKCIFE